MPDRLSPLLANTWLEFLSDTGFESLATTVSQSYMRPPQSKSRHRQAHHFIGTVIYARHITLQKAIYFHANPMATPRSASFKSHRVWLHNFRFLCSNLLGKRNKLSVLCGTPWPHPLQHMSKSHIFVGCTTSFPLSQVC